MRTIKMKPIWHFGSSLGVAVLALLLSVAPAFGHQLSSDAWHEDGDAGDGVLTAQNTTGSGPLTGINGVLTGLEEVSLDPPLPLDVVDMFRIRASSGATAITVTNTEFNTADFLVFLFNPVGVGLGAGYFAASSAKTLEVLVTEGLEYLLAISLPFYGPVDSTGAALFDSGGLPVGNVLAGWSDAAGATVLDPPFSFTLEGVDPVPEPATLLLLGAGLVGLGAAAWRRRRQ